MSEVTTNPLGKELNTQPSLQHIVVRDGVELRPVGYEDSTAIIDILDADPSIRQRVTVAARMKTEAEVQLEVDSLKTDPDHIRYALIDNNETMGLVSLWRDEGYMTGQPDPRVFGFGFFTHPEARGRGLVTDSVKALVETVQTNLDVDSFIAFCEDNNTDSIAVLKNAGFEPTDKVHQEPENGWAERMYKKEVVNE